MMFAPRRYNMVLRVLAGSFYDLPCPINLNMWWNFGSMMGVLLVIQVLSGFIMACHYTPHESLAFSSVVHIMHDVHEGWLVRSLHSNGASFFFICVYAHIGRGIYYHSFTLTHTWSVGVSMYLLLMAIAFLGYVLPWGQMSYWGATVITNLFTAIPYVGRVITEWIWGGYSVCDATLKRFYVLHLYLPFVLMGLAVIHLYYLHETGSNNPLGIDDGGDLIPFHPYYSHKDFLGILIMVGALLLIVLFEPDLFASPENFIPANPYKTPLHIQPEWYFLFAYTILRSVPNKGGGVAALAASVLILYALPLRPKYFHLGLAFYPVSQAFFWLFVSSFMMLTFIGMRPVQEPYIFMGQVSMVIYFMYFPLQGVLERGWDILMSYLQFSIYEEDSSHSAHEKSNVLFYDGGKELEWNDL
uniref:Cytochrome b n=1 Tax=Nuttallia olivacea TaxID=1125678 RepID=I6NJQ0_9BIVA|nr:cytochrome b [Nuttallia olivacea]AEV94297.1 cytochrome b [Nuttallia olivacea]